MFIFKNLISRSVAAGCLLTASLAAGGVLIDWDAEWRYSEEPAAGWQAPGFDDGGWASGPALLGYDTGNRASNWPAPGLRTEMPPRRIHYALRHHFDFDREPAGVLLVIDQVIDDAAVYFLNGVEIARTARLPDGPVAADTSATSAVGLPALDEQAFVIANAPLHRGGNVLAVSLHNHDERSSDICFGMRLTMVDGAGGTKLTPPGLLLTWREDPATTIMIDWHRHAVETGLPAAIQMRPRGDDAGEWRAFEADRFEFPFSDRLVDRVEVKGLQPDTAYEFRGGPTSETYYFRTMPTTLERPLVIAQGGDMMHRREWFEAANRVAMSHDPDFILWGGDLAYADGREDRVDRWHTYFNAMMRTLVAEDGRVPPVVTCIGNHEVRGGYRGDRISGNADRLEYAPYFYRLFAFPGHPGYAALDFGNYLSLLIGDTTHTAPIAGAQTEWWAEALAERAGRPHVIPVYHIPAWPSVRDFDGSASRALREHWVPLFERHGVRLVFEHHDHAYKRTVPITAGEADPENGVIYIGDGCWGVATREVAPAESTWYLEKSQSVQHVIILRLTPTAKHVTVHAHDGGLLDEVRLPVDGRR